MVKLTQEGTYRGLILDHGVSQTKNGYPQFVVNLSALESWNENDEEWIDFSEYDAGMMGYFVLVGGDAKPLLNMDQVMKATGWDGQSFSVLDSMDLSNTMVQFRVEWNEYNGNESLQVSWIDHMDATPGVKVKKLDKDELKTLDAQYKNVLKLVSGKSSPVVSKKNKPKSTTSEKPKRRGRPPKVKPEDTPDPESDISTPQPCDIETAWGDFAAQAEKIKLDGDEINKIWLEVIENIVGDKDEDDITDEEYGQIRAKLLAHPDICPF